MVSFVNKPSPATSPKATQSFGSSRRIILTRMYADSDHQSASRMSIEKIEANASWAVTRDPAAARTWAHFPPPNSLAIMPATKTSAAPASAGTTWISKSPSPPIALRRAAMYAIIGGKST